MRTLRTPLHTIATALALGYAMTASAQTTPTPAAPNDGTLLSISAEAKATRVPDVATLSTGVVTQAADANSALRANAEAMGKVMSAVKAAGIAERDVQTTGINIYPQYRYAENQAPAITGYQASNTVSVKVRDMARIGKVLDALVANGANQVNGPSFEIDEPEAAYDEARVAAIKKAQARAKLYADALGLRIRRVVSVSEGGGFSPPMPQPVMLKAAAMEMADTPVSPGESNLSARVDVVFELGR
ncbi:MAG: SIMPL domain-containing protein [Lysobacteraceae bacterium]|nr:MAG: SIMPL domain-containing protein [Xanthomonadaceae bacterium]